MIKLDIVIPVYNEDENIIRLLKSLEEEIACDFRVLICYDNESDQTLKYLKDRNIILTRLFLLKKRPQVKVFFVQMKTQLLT